MPMTLVTAIIVLLAFFVWPLVLVIAGAKRKNRSVLGWSLVQSGTVLMLMSHLGTLNSLFGPFSLIVFCIPAIVVSFLPKKPLTVSADHTPRPKKENGGGSNQPTNALLNLFHQYHDLLYKRRFHAGQELSKREEEQFENGIVNLLNKGSDLRSRDGEGRSPLMLAAQCHSVPLISSLLKVGASVEDMDCQGWTALSYCMRNQLTAETSDNNGKNIYYTIWSGDSRCMQLLLDAGANPNLRDTEGRRPLTHAVVPFVFSSGNDPKPWRLVFHSDARIVQELLTAGAEVNARDCNGRTALRYEVYSIASGMWPSEAVAADIFGMLVHFGADPNQRDAQEKTVLMDVLEPYSPLRWPHPFYLNIVLQLLLKSGADVNAVYPQGGSPWTRTIQTMRNMYRTFGEQHYKAKLHESFMQVIRLLISGGADGNAVCAGGKTPFEIAAELRLHDLLDLLSNSKEYSHGASDNNFGSTDSSYLGKYYSVLGCSERDSDDQVKGRYRKLVKDYHPDTIQGKQLPEEFVKFAHEKFREIQEAFELIRRARGMN
jgi:ankyrin repeat protein